MSIKVHTNCEKCDVATSYVDEKGTVFFQKHAHSVDACDLERGATIRHLRDEVLRLNQLVNEERSYNQRKLIRAPQDQKEKLLDQIYRWKTLFEEERMKRWKLRKQIMYVYGTLDFKVETGSIVDSPAKAVAEYTSRKLRELIRTKS